MTESGGIEFGMTRDDLSDILVYEGDIHSISLFENHSTTILNDGRVVYCCYQTNS